MKMTITEAIAKAQELAYKDYHIHAGVERKAVAKDWEGKRTYINIYCYTMNGRYVGKYDCGYIDKETEEYVTTKYTEVDLANGEWIGR